jgi:glutathione synthase/RimK-type ligase-like ATP-grasp enzyme
MSSPLRGTTIAFVTSNEYSDLTPSDLIAAGALRAEGASIVPAVWDNPIVEWKRFDCIIIRSTWDYHLRPGLFRKWIDSLETQGARVWNPPAILRWNMDKHYLLDVGKNGTRIPRTMFFGLKETIDAVKARSYLGTDEVVVKPVISASAWNTRHCTLKELSGWAMQWLETLPEDSSVMVQEFMPEVASEGEWSLIFFGGRFSHAVKKYPAKGDFRVQEALGGRAEFQPDPPRNIVGQGRAALEAIERRLLYARVDGIVRDGSFIVMELELLEPTLYFELDPGAGRRFSLQIAEVMSQR